jgi:hypothetical protein
MSTHRCRFPGLASFPGVLEREQGRLASKWPGSVSRASMHKQLADREIMEYEEKHMAQQKAALDGPPVRIRQGRQVAMRVGWR